MGLEKIGLKVFTKSVYAGGGVIEASFSSVLLVPFPTMDDDLSGSRHVVKVRSRSSDGKTMLLGVVNGRRVGLVGPISRIMR